MYGGAYFAFDGFGCGLDWVWKEIAENFVKGAPATVLPTSFFGESCLKMSLILVDVSVAF